MTEVQRRLAALERDRERRKTAQETANGVSVTDHIAAVYLPLHADILGGDHVFYNLPGGRGSAKSSFVSLEIVGGIMSDQLGLTNAIVFRRFASTLRESVFSQIAWAIDVLNVGHLWRGSVSPMNFTYLPTGAQIVFRGLDDPAKLKSIKPRRGTFRFVWLEEFAELPGENFARNVLQSVLRGGGAFTVFRSFNPPLSRTNWANTFVARPDPRAVTLHTSYLDIPPDWLGESFILEAERLKTVNKLAYRHEYLGEATGSGGEVFPNLEIREITDAEIEKMQYIYCGLDFGFAVDPACYIVVSYDATHDCLYLLDEIYKRGLSNRQLAELIRQSALGGGSYVFCDSAEPKSIADLRNEGIAARACSKFPGSVLYGIRWLQHRRIVIDPARTPNAHREFVGYEYATTTDGEFLADVPDKDNHSIDAVRYALDRLINARRFPA